jgi:dolichol-phosphate mannosyltransferase
MSTGGLLAFSIVVPTRNEAPNIPVLVGRLKRSLDALSGGWELIFVDDSDDNTPEVVRDLARSDARVRLLHRARGARPGGLGGAVQEGFALARGHVIAVMDADLQHPPEVLPALLAPAVSGEAELVAASRYCEDGGTGGLDGPWRRFVSWSCRWLARRLVPASKPLEDPLSGLFALRRSVIEGAPLRPDGYKILLEVAARGNWRTAANVPYTFAERYAGNSNAGLREGLIFFRHLARLALSSRGRDLSRTGIGPAPLVPREPAKFH